MSSPERGFTLIELLVVVSIIGLLASVVMVSLNSAKAKGRDARRMRDIEEIHTAIELYITDHGNAPDGFAVDKDSASWNDLATVLAPYIKKLPIDPCGTSSSCVVDNPGPDGTWLAYVYKGPSYVFAVDGSTTNDASYLIEAENLEAKAGKNFGFGVGSF